MVSHSGGRAPDVTNGLVAVRYRQLAVHQYKIMILRTQAIESVFAVYSDVASPAHSREDIGHELLADSIIFSHQDAQISFQGRPDRAEPGWC